MISPHTGPEREATRTRVRRLNRVILLPPLVATGALLVVLDSRAWWQAVILSVGLAAAVVACWRWAATDVLPVAVPCLLVTAAVWVVGALVIGTPNAYFGLAIVGSTVIPELPRRRVVAAVGLCAGIAAVGAARLVIAPEVVLSSYVLVPTGVSVVIIGLMFPTKRFYDLIRELDESRERVAELAVMRERVRFATDLHDIQGHTLHVVKLKATLAQKLVRTDAARAEEELREIHALVSDTIAQAKELAYAQRRLNLTAELENAKNLFEAAGIRVRITRVAEVGDRALLGQVLRETTTNILRHAQATQVQVTLSEAGITIVNDGAPGDGPLELRGLSALRQRVTGDGGALTVERKDGRFLTAATFAREGDR